MERLLDKQSIKRKTACLSGVRLTATEGKIYDETGESVRPHIEAFISAYELPLDELLVQDLDQYPVSPDCILYMLNVTTDLQLILFPPPSPYRSTYHFPLGSKRHHLSC